MGKKRSWFGLVKRLFNQEGKQKEGKNSRRWRWVFGRLKIKQYPAISVPQRTLGEATEEQRKHAVAVAIATAAAAEAAVTAAHAAAEVVRLTSNPSCFLRINHNLAATKIQTSFRSYLARKALRALKGVVMLQAVIRGQNIRRLIITNLKPLPSTLKPQPKVHQTRVSSTDEISIYEKERESSSSKKVFENQNTKIHCRSNKKWDYSVFSNEDTKSSWLQSQDAITRRDQMMKYSFSYRERRSNFDLEEFSNKEEGRRRPWFEEHKDVEVPGANQTEKLKRTIHSNSVDVVTNGTRHLKLRNGLKMEILNSSLVLPRRSFCRENKQEKSVLDEISLPNSPVFPTYMAVTESAKAKTRSASTPRQSCGNPVFYAIHSQYKPKLSSWSSFDGDLARPGRKGATTQHRSVESKVK